MRSAYTQDPSKGYVLGEKSNRLKIAVTPQVRHPERSEGSQPDWNLVKFRRSFATLWITYDQDALV